MHMKEILLAAKGGRGAVAGVSGNVPMHGAVDSGEYLRKLDGVAGRAVFDEMRRSDPQVRAGLNAVTLPIRQTAFTVEPPTDDPKDVEIAATLNRRLASEMTITWDDTIRHALLMFPFGFSILEKVWEIDRNGLVMPKKLDPRLPQSIVRWETDTQGSLVNIVQRDSQGKEYFLPIEKCLVFSNEKEGDNWEGQAILRPAYKAWFIKNSLEKINAIKHDRHGVGVPKAKVPAGVARGSEEWNATEDALKRLYANEQSFVIEPDGYTVDILGGSGKEGADALPSIKYYDEMIAKSMLAMFINLGTSETGSRALGASFIELFLMSLQASADYVAQVLSRYLIREWVNYNWAVDEYPVMKAAQIRSLDPTVLKTLVDARLLTPDDAIESAMRVQMRLPEKEESEAEEEPEPKPESEVEAEPETEERKPEADGEPAVDETQPEAKLSDREPTAEEKLVDYTAYAMQLNDAQDTLLARILGMRAAQVQDVIVQVVAGRKPQDIRVILKKEMYEALAREFKRQVDVGRKQVAEEVERQVGTRGKRFAVARSVKPKRVAELYDEQFELWVEGAADKVKSMVSSAALSARKTGLSGDALMQKLVAEFSPAEFGNATWDAMAGGAVNGGWGVGRQSGLGEVSDGIDYCYYSAILDDAACEVCASLDGQHHEVDDPNYQTPNPDCYGTEARCRCMTIAVMRVEGEGAER